MFYTLHVTNTLLHTIFSTMFMIYNIHEKYSLDCYDKNFKVELQHLLNLGEKINWNIFNSVLHPKI